MLNSQKYKICLLAATVVLSISVPPQCNAEEHVTGQIKTADDRHWRIAQENVHKFFNMPPQKLLNVLGRSNYKYSLDDVLIYNLDNEVYVRFHLKRGCVSSFSFIHNGSRQNLPLEEEDLPSSFHVTDSVAEKEKPISDKRWLIVKANIRKFMNTPRQELLTVLGPPSSKFSREEVLAYYLGDGVEIRFRLRNNSVSSFTISRYIAKRCPLPGDTDRRRLIITN